MAISCSSFHLNSAERAAEVYSILEIKPAIIGYPQDEAVTGRHKSTAVPSQRRASPPNIYDTSGAERLETAISDPSNLAGAHTQASPKVARSSSQLN